MWEAWLECLYQMANFAELEEAVRDLPAAADESADCWKFRAIAAEHREDWERAIEAAQRAVELDPYEPEHYYRLGNEFIRSGNKQEGQKYLTRSQQVAEAQKNLSDAFLEYQKHYKPEQQPPASVSHQVGQAYEKLGNQEEAAAWYRAALAENPAHTPSITALMRLQTEPMADDLAPPP